MPLVRYEIRSEHSLANPDLYRSAKDEPEGLLEGVAVAGLVGIVRQIGDLAEFAADIFRDLHEEVMAVSSRSHDLAIRVQQIEAEMPSVEKALLSETNQLKFAYNRGTEWHASIRADQNHCTQGDLPRFIRNSYEECRGPPKLFLLDRFDVAGAGACLKRYTDPSYFKTEWASSELMKAEQAQRDNKAKRGKKKARRRKGSSESVDSIPVTQINSRVRYSSRGVETEGAAGSSSSLKSEYLSKQKELPITDSVGASSSSSSKGSRAPLSIIQGQETGLTSRAPVSTAYLKQPRVALPSTRGVESSGSGSGTTSSLDATEQLANPARQTQSPSLQRIEAVPGSSTVHQGFQSREALPPSLGVGNSVQVLSPDQVHSKHPGQESGSRQLSPDIATDQPLKLSAMDIEAESLSGRFVRVQQKTNVDEVQENGTEPVACSESDEHSPPATPVSARLQDEPAHPASDREALNEQAAAGYGGNNGNEQKVRADSTEDIAGEVENFVDALATMDSDGETDPETRTSESRPKIDGDGDVDVDDDEVQSELVELPTGNVQEVEDSPGVLIKTHPDLFSHVAPRIEVSSPKVHSPSPLNDELVSAEIVALSSEEPLSPTESSARLSPSNRTVNSADLISPSESSMGFSSPGALSEIAVAPQSYDTAMSQTIEEDAAKVGLSSPGQEPSHSMDLQTTSQGLNWSATPQAPVEVTGLPTRLHSCVDTSAETFPPGKSDERPPSPRGLTATSTSRGPALFVPSQAASNAAVGSMSVPAIDIPSPTGTVIVLPSPSIVERAPWDLSSQAGSASELSTPRRVEGYAHDLASPAGSTSDTSSLDKGRSPSGPNPVISNMDGDGAPARDLPSPVGSLPSIGKESPSFEHSGFPIPSPVALQVASAFVLADDSVSPGLEAAGERQHFRAESSKKMESVGGVVTEHLTDVEQEYSSRGGPEAGLEERPLSPILESTDGMLVDQRDEDLASSQDVSAGTSEENVGALKEGVLDKNGGEAKLNPADPLLHLLSSEDDPEDELDEELAKAVGSQQLPLSPSPASSPSPRAHKFSVLDPLSLSDTEAKDPESSPRGSDGSSPRSSVFSALNSPMSPPLQSRKFMKSPETRRGRSFRASEVVSPVSPTHSSKVPPLRTPASQAMPEILPLLPPMNPGQWQGLSAYHERRHSVPVEFGRSPARVQPAAAIPVTPDAQTALPTPPMPTRRAPVAGQQSVNDAIGAHDKSKLKKVPPSPTKLSTDLDREVMLQQISTQSFSLRDTMSDPKAKPESSQRPVTNINVAAILEKANAIRQAFTGSEEDDDDDDQWSDK